MRNKGESFKEYVTRLVKPIFEKVIKEHELKKTIRKERIERI